jgi:hypothetical protein
VEAHTPGSNRRGSRARKAAYLTAGVAASASIIAGSLAGLNVHVLGFTDWPIVGHDGPVSQVLPDPARGETIARLEAPSERPAALAIPGEGAPEPVAGGELAAGGTPLAGLVVGAAGDDGGRFATAAAATRCRPREPTSTPTATGSATRSSACSAPTRCAATPTATASPTPTRSSIA